MDDQDTVSPSKNTLEQLSQLARALRDEEAEVEEAERILKAAKETVRRLKEEDIPGVMSELQLTSIKLESGETITISDEVYAAIPVAEREHAFAWLERNGFGGLIKTEVTIAFGKQQSIAAQELCERLASEGLEPEMARSVHPQTLKAFLKEQLAAAAAIPLEMFGARPVKLAKITAPKAKKS